MPNTPEDRAREKIDRLLQHDGWRIFDRDNADIDTPGTMIRQFPVSGGIADYAIYANGKCAGVIEAKASAFRFPARKYINSLFANIPWCGRVSVAIYPKRRGGAYEVFGDDLDAIIAELNEHLVA